MMLVLAASSFPVKAADLASQQTTGVDSIFVYDNPADGVSCFASKPPVNTGETPIWANCTRTQGYLIAIPSNDMLLNTALASKMKGNNTWIMIDRAGHVSLPGSR